MSWQCKEPGHQQLWYWFDSPLYYMLCRVTVNTLRQRQHGRHLPDNIFKCIFLNENVWISIKISLKFVPKGPINNIPALLHIMAWRLDGAKPLYEAMMVNLPTHICVSRPQWVNNLNETANIWETTFSDALSWKENVCNLFLIALNFVSKPVIYCKSALVRLMAWHWTGNKQSVVA